MLGDFKTIRTARAGNVLFLILIAVALFAALSYAVTRSSSGGGRATEAENAKLAAGEILGWATSVEQAVMRMRVVQRVPINKLDFENAANTTVGGATMFSATFNTNCTSDPTCQVFHVSGGGAADRNFEQYGVVDASWSAAWSKWGHVDFQVMRVIEVGSDANDLVMRIYGLRADVCLEINKKMGITSPAGVLPNENVNNYNAFDGTNIDVGTVGILGDDYAGFRGKKAFCRYGDDAARGRFYYVLIER